MKLLPVIMSGGSGSRLWPVSRKEYPKPFVELPGGGTLIEKTYSRVSNIPEVEDVLTITNRDYYFMSKDVFSTVQADKKHLTPHFLLEPVARNTAPAVAMAALMAVDKWGEDTVLLVLPADHLIGEDDSFAECVKQAQETALADNLVTFGIRPDEPDTGFGYIEVKDKNEPGGCCGQPQKVQRFVEKPPIEKAIEYFESGKYLWNSGMFCFKAGVLLEGFKNHAPEVYAASIDCYEKSKSNSQDLINVMEIDLPSFEAVPEDSIDYALMERADNVMVIPSKFKWNDVGSWHAMGEMLLPDENENRIDGEAVVVDVTNTFIQSPHRIVACVGVNDLIVVDTHDALLVADKGRVQDVKKIVEKLKVMGHDSAQLHRTVVRPWGTYTVLEEDAGYKIKRIVVKPEQSLSLQMHHHRSEHWVVVSGIAEVVNGESDLLLKENESTYIPAGNKHRLVNPGKVELVLIEVQSGEYLGEDDIVRFEDVYGRRTDDLPVN